MNTILISRTGGPDVLQIKTTPMPNPGEGEVLIEVKAAGVNFADILTRKGLYPDAPKLPLVPGYEVAGIIRSVGTEVDNNLIGKQVMSFTCFGGYSEYVAVSANQVFIMPHGLGFEDAVTLPVAYCTAYLLVIIMGSLQPDETILIHNAGSGVGLAAMEIAKKTGTFIIGTSNAGKHQKLKEMGFDLLIDYRNERWEKVINKYSGYRNIDLIIDPLGGKNWRKSYRMLGPTGRLGIYGISSVCGKKTGSFLNLLRAVLEMPVYHPLSFLDQNKGVFGVNMAHLWDHPAKIRNWMNHIIDGLQAGWIRPHLDRVFKFSEASQAHSYIESRQNIGKVILIPDTIHNAAQVTRINSNF